MRKLSCMFIRLLLLLTSHACLAVAPGSNSEPPVRPAIGQDSLVYRVLVCRSPGVAMESMLDADSNRGYLGSLKAVYNGQQSISDAEFQQMIDTLKYNLGVLPSSRNTQEEWMEIAKILAFLVKTVQGAEEKGNNKITQESANRKTVLLRELVKDTDFALKAYPDIYAFWKEETRFHLIKLRNALNRQDKSSVITNVERECLSTSCIKGLLAQIEEPDNSWLSTARAMFSLARSFTIPVSIRQTHLSSRKSAKETRQKVVVEFLEESKNIETIKSAFSSVTERMDQKTLPFWRLKAMQFFVTLLHALESEYGQPVKGSWLSERDKSILGQNAQMVDHALAVEGFCPLNQKTRVCSSPTVQPDDQKILSAVANWHKSEDMHFTKLYDSWQMYDLSLDLADLAGMDTMHLTLSSMVVTHLDYARKKTEVLMDEIQALETMFSSD